MSREAVIKDFFKKIESRDLDGILGLFAKEGTLNSPVYGTFSVAEFYEKLFADTKDFHVDVIDMYTSTSHPEKLIAHVVFSTTLNNNDKLKAEGIDIFEFVNGSEKIQSGKFIYDSQQAKEKITALHG